MSSQKWGNLNRRPGGRVTHACMTLRLVGMGRVMLYAKDPPTAVAHIAPARCGTRGTRSAAQPVPTHPPRHRPPTAPAACVGHAPTLCSLWTRTHSAHVSGALLPMA